jgi:hypothetical protein
MQLQESCTDAALPSLLQVPVSHLAFVAAAAALGAVLRAQPAGTAVATQVL